MKIHPIVMLFILTVKYRACLHAVYLLLMTTPCHRMGPPAPQLLGGTSRCCHSTAPSVDGQLLRWSWQMGVKALVFFVLTQIPAFRSVMGCHSLCLAHDSGTASCGVHTSGPYLSNLAMRNHGETLLNQRQTTATPLPSSTETVLPPSRNRKRSAWSGTICPR